MKNFLFWLILGWFLVFWYFFVKENPENIYVVKGQTRINKMLKKNPSVSIANPASTYCIENNGKLEIKNEESGQTGICTFSDWSSCEERAFFRGECTPWQEIPQEVWQETPTQGEPTMCTMEYAPVCAKVEIQCVTTPCEPIEQTFSNKCMMEANKLATFLYEWECTTNKIECPQYMPPSADFCPNWTIQDQGTDKNGCQLSPKCVSNE